MGAFEAWRRHYAEIGADNPETLAGKAVANGWHAPKRSEFVQAVYSLKYASLEAFFADRLEGSTLEEIAASMGFAYATIHKYYSQVKGKP